MIIKALTCRNFRNIEELEAGSFDEMNVICGENAQGKTNMLESIWLFTGMKSFRGSRDSELVKKDREKAVNGLEFVSAGTEESARLEISERRTAFLNGKKLKAASELAEHFSAVVFSPGDLSLIKDGPAVRRRFLDTAIGQLYPAYIGILKKYTRAVIQRNSVIKDYRYDRTLEIMLDSFEDEIAAEAVKIVKFRARYISLLKEILPEIYGGISSGKESLETFYMPSAADDIKERLKAARTADMLTGSTSAGPHRDDIDFKINGMSARSYGSQGQKRSVALSLKLAEAEIIKNISGEYPVFLLDDVMSELDPDRQSYILNRVKGIQTFITCCDPSNTASLEKGRIIYIENGRIK